MSSTPEWVVFQSSNNTTAPAGVFNTQNYQNDWYGQLNGQNLPEGAYWYVIYLGDENQVLRGAVTIKR